MVLQIIDLLYIKYESQEPIEIKVHIYLLDEDEERGHVNCSWKKVGDVIYVNI